MLQLEQAVATHQTAPVATDWVFLLWLEFELSFRLGFKFQLDLGLGLGLSVSSAQGEVWS